MRIFCGSSSVRLFQSDLAGANSYNSFSGSTIKGLLAARSGSAHGAVVQALARIPVRKKIFLMFGEVDIDFTFYRVFCEKFEIDIDEFTASRLAIYNEFLASIIDDPAARDHLEGIFVLCPHPTPLRDQEFFGTTAANAQIAQERLREAGAFLDLGHAARIRRLLAFNDAFEQGLLKHERISVRRIDDICLDSNGMLVEKFFSRYRTDHHLAQGPALLSWYEKLRRDVPDFDRVLAAREAKS